MRRHALLGCALVALGLAGCGGQQQSATPEARPEAPIAEPAPAAVDSPVGPSRYDSGPRAGAGAVDAALAATGEKLFQTRICATCHGFGKAIAGPDLRGVTMRRTHEWLKQQIMHPDVMVKEDPLSWRARQGFPAPMPAQNLTEAEASALIEYLKQRDRAAGVAAQ